MKLTSKWLALIVLHLLSLSRVSLATTAAVAAASRGNGGLGSAHLVAGLYIGLAVNSQPRADPNLDATTTFVQLASKELTLPIMPLYVFLTLVQLSA